MTTKTKAYLPEPADLGARLAQAAELLDQAVAVLNSALNEIKTKDEGESDDRAHPGSEAQQDRGQ